MKARVSGLFFSGRLPFVFQSRYFSARYILVPLSCFHLVQVVVLCGGEEADMWRSLTLCSPLNLCIAANTFDLAAAAAAAR